MTKWTKVVTGCQNVWQIKIVHKIQDYGVFMQIWHISEFFMRFLMCHRFWHLSQRVTTLSQHVTTLSHGVTTLSQRVTSTKNWRSTWVLTIYDEFSNKKTVSPWRKNSTRYPCFQKFSTFFQGSDVQVKMGLRPNRPHFRNPRELSYIFYFGCQGR